MENADIIINDVRRHYPLIHCITNPISINDCANAVLALGGRPIMAEHPGEVAEITRTSAALCLNIGNITDARMESMRVAAKTASECEIPIVLDIVGITCSTLRYNYVKNLISEIRPAVIKGNLSEIKKLSDNRCRFVGIDSAENPSDNEELRAAAELVKELSAATGSVIAASGRTDIISDGANTAYVDNGCELMSRVTGTGCMLNVIIGTILASDRCPVFYRAVLGTAILGICGELAQTYGTDMLGSYHINLINALSAFTIDDIRKMAKIRFLAD